MDSEQTVERRKFRRFVRLWLLGVYAGCLAFSVVLCAVIFLLHCNLATLEMSNSVFVGIAIGFITIDFSSTVRRKRGLQRQMSRDIRTFCAGVVIGLLATAILSVLYGAVTFLPLTKEAIVCKLTGMIIGALVAGALSPFNSKETLK